MRTNVFVCQNPFQIMVASIIRTNFNSENINDVIITGMVPGMDRRAAKLRELGCYRNVYYVDTKVCNYNYKKIDCKLRKGICEIRGCNLEIVKKLPYDYTDIYSMDVTCLSGNICRELQKRGRKPSIHLFEEGFGCYTDYYYKHLYSNNIIKKLIIEIMSKIRKSTPALECVQELLLFELEFLRWKPQYKVTQIKKPALNKDRKLIDELNYIFEYSNEFNYQQQVIFFEDCIYQDTGDSRDFQVIKELANHVGKENIIVKLHPRTKNNRFISDGFSTEEKQGIPWEIVAMNMKEDDNHVFLTFTSSSVVTQSLLFNKHYSSMMLFKCLPEFAHNVNNDVLSFLEEYAKKKPDVLFIPNTLEEAYKQIDMLIKGEKDE